MASELYPPAEADRAGAEPSLAATAKGILDDVLELVVQQLAMFKAEMRADLRKAIAGVIPLLGGVAPLLLGGLMLCFTLVHLLHWATLPAGAAADPATIPLWGCYAIVAAVFLLIGISLLGIGIYRLKPRQSPAPGERQGSRGEYPMADESDPEVIHRQMAVQRAALAQKLETLENKIVNTVEGAREAVAETVQTFKDGVKDSVETVRDSVHTSVASVKETFDVKLQVQRHPWAMFGGSIAAGFVAGWLPAGASAPPWTRGSAPPSPSRRQCPASRLRPHRCRRHEPSTA